MCNGSFFLISVDRGTHQCALETRLSQLVVPLVEVLLRKDLLRALLGSLGAGLIDLLGPLPCGGDQTHFAIQHAQQPAHAGGAAALAVGDLLTAKYGMAWMEHPTSYRKEEL